MSRNPYKDYYEAMARGDEWSGLDAAEAKKRIEMLEDSDYANPVYQEDFWDPINN